MARVPSTGTFGAAADGRINDDGVAAARGGHPRPEVPHGCRGDTAHDHNGGTGAGRALGPAGKEPCRRFLDVAQVREHKDNDGFVAQCGNVCGADSAARREVVQGRR